MRVTLLSPFHSLRCFGRYTYELIRRISRQAVSDSSLTV
ncbi:hypothetical protein M514_03975 [Trichuris suis]|uniref:Uncharacterized protein n=1 Tax=Trichuris suis TaxID=68888 RepID=A0A085MCW1_9BILA|nr:hypothetical protein M513_03975 [Trichuris suis]KFD72585.1 hypothetical protein M514_03975 [Trichuris suis]